MFTITCIGSQYGHDNETAGKVISPQKIFRSLLGEVMLEKINKVTLYLINRSYIRRFSDEK